MLILLPIYSVAIFASGGVVFASTFAPAPLVSMRETWPLHIGAILSFGAMILTLGRRSRDLRRREPALSRYDTRVLTSVSAAVWLVGALGAILLLLALTQFSEPLEGTATILDGKYVLSSHGRIIREITRDAYLNGRRAELRGFSGCWMILSWCPMVFFCLSPGRDFTVPPSGSSPTASGQL